MTTSSTDRPVAVITGSSSGIGAASAVRFAQAGFDVVVNYSRKPEPAAAVAERCRAAGAAVLLVQADVSDDAACRALAEGVRARFRRCDVLVNNAGRTKFVDARNLDGLSAEDFQSIYAVNVIGAFQMVRALAPLLNEAEKAAIVNVSSIAGTLAMGSSIAYAASKGALNNLTLALARALGPRIRVNAVAPGMIDGEWLREGLGPERFAIMRQRYEERVALATIMTPEDIAESIFYLAVLATKTTGEVLHVDGGMRTGRG